GALSFPGCEPKILVSKGTKGGTEGSNLIVPPSALESSLHLSKRDSRTRTAGDIANHSVRKHCSAAVVCGVGGVLRRPHRSQRQVRLQPGRERPPSRARFLTPRPARGGRSRLG